MDSNRAGDTGTQDDVIVDGNLEATHVIKPELSNVCRMTEVDAELQRWEALEGYRNETMGTVDLFHF